MPRIIFVPSTADKAAPSQKGQSLPRSQFGCSQLSYVRPTYVPDAHYALEDVLQRVSSGVAPHSCLETSSRPGGTQGHACVRSHVAPRTRANVYRLGHPCMKCAEGRVWRRSGPGRGRVGGDRGACLVPLSARGQTMGMGDDMESELNGQTHARSGPGMEADCRAGSMGTWKYAIRRCYTQRSIQLENGLF